MSSSSSMASCRSQRIVPSRVPAWRPNAEGSRAVGLGEFKHQRMAQPLGSLPALAGEDRDVLARSTQSP